MCFKLNNKYIYIYIYKYMLDYYKLFDYCKKISEDKNLKKERHRKNRESKQKKQLFRIITENAYNIIKTCADEGKDFAVIYECYK